MIIKVAEGDEFEIELPDGSKVQAEVSHTVLILKQDRKYDPPKPSVGPGGRPGFVTGGSTTAYFYFGE